MAILSIQIIPYVFAGMMTQVLYALNKGRSYLRASFALFIVAVSGFLVLIPTEGYLGFGMGYGGDGAAASVVAAYIVFALVLMWMVKRTTGYRLYPKFWKIIIAFALCILSLYAIDYVIGAFGLIGLAVKGLFCEFVFIIILIAMHEIEKSDILTIWKKFRDDED